MQSPVLPTAVKVIAYLKKSLYIVRNAYAATYCELASLLALFTIDNSCCAVWLNGKTKLQGSGFEYCNEYAHPCQGAPSIWHTFLLNHISVCVWQPASMQDCRNVSLIILCVNFRFLKCQSPASTFSNMSSSI